MEVQPLQQLMVEQIGGLLDIQEYNLKWLKLGRQLGKINRLSCSLVQTFRQVNP